MRIVFIYVLCMFLHQVCLNFFIRSTFGDAEVAIEMNKKEKRGGPGDMLPLAEFINVSIT